jgi:branched-chain amino acid transport system substrate-binding protein
MNRRSFLTTTATGTAVLAFPNILKAQSKDPIRIGFPLPLTGTFAAIAADMQKGALLAIEEVNAKGGIMGRKLEVLFRDDELKTAVGAQRTKELIENQKVDFVIGGIAAHIQMAINEQTKAAKKLYISLSQSDEISAKPDTSPLTFHEALNPTITSRAMATFGVQNIGKKWWIVYADYAFGKQNTAVFSALVPKLGGTILGSTPYPLGKPEFSAHLPKIQAAKPDAIYAITPGADSVPFMKQAISFGLKKDARIAQPLHFLDYAKEAGAETFQDVYGATHFCHELAETIPQVKRYVEAFTKKFNRPPDAYSGYGYSGILEVARGVELAKSTDSDAVANALRKNREYDHYKGKQWWRACDNKSFQDLWILKVRSPQQVKGEWGFFDVVGKVAANEELDRTCAEKGHA